MHGNRGNSRKDPDKSWISFGNENAANETNFDKHKISKDMQMNLDQTEKKTKLLSREAVYNEYKRRQNECNN